MADKIGDAQFRIMCNMWGVDAAVAASKRMDMIPTEKQIDAAREKERASQERWNSIFKPKEDT